ncbi:MAG TPA: PQQ-binding-like beta-propeller repeat protein [Ktedonobacterales bacterium]|jgi:outer membrane protein assembly factor BamB
MNLSAFAQFPWLPWTLALAVMLVVGLIMLAVRARRWWLKALLVLSTVLVVSGSLAGLGTAILSRASLANRAAPVPDSLSLSFMDYAPKPGSVTSSLITLNARTGAVRAQRSFPGNVYVYSVADEHTLYLVGGFTTTVTAMRASDGKYLWQTPLLSPTDPQRHLSPIASAVPSDGMLYFITGGDAGELVVLGLNANTGELVWHVSITDASIAAQTVLLAVEQNMVFVTISNSELIALRGSDGAQMWSARLAPGEALAGFPIFADGVVYIITNLQTRPNQASSRRIVALDGRDGTQLWSHPLDGQIATLARTPAGVGASSIYLEGSESVGNHDAHYLYSISAQSGNVQWKYPVTVAEGDTVSATEANNLVYIANSGETYLDAVRVGDGQRVWRHSAETNIGFGAPVVDNGVLFVKSLPIHRAGMNSDSCSFNCEPSTAIYAFDAATGSLYWHSAWAEMDILSPPWVTTDA